MKKTNLFFILFILGLIVAFTIGIRRFWTEQKDKKVEIAVDYDRLFYLAQQEGISFEELLARFHKIGVTTVGLKEDTINSLQQQGRVFVIRGNELLAKIYLAVKTSRNSTYLVVPQEELASRLFNHLSWKVDKKLLHLFQHQNYQIIELKTINEELINNLGLGFSLSKIRQISQSGLKIVLRPSNYLKVSPGYISFLFKDIKNWQNISAIVFAGEEVLGYPKVLATTVEFLKNIPVPIGIVEFSSQKGIEEITRPLVLENKIVRVHSITEKEIEEIEKEERKASIEELQERWLRAVGERRIRLLYFYPFLQTFGGYRQTCLDLNLDYVSQVKSGLEQEGFEIEAIDKLSFFRISKLEIILVSLACLSGIVLLLNRIVFLSPTVNWLIYAGGLLFFSFCWYKIIIFQKIMALFAAIVFPCWAILVMNEKITIWRQWTSYKNYLRQSILIFLYTCGLSLSGALVIVGLLSDKIFLVKIESFSGVKLALLIPILFIIGIYIYRQGWRWLEALLEEKLSVKYLMVVLLVVFAGIVYVLRSGNEANFLIGTTEEKLRQVLDTLLVVRPRTKEFLIGHPFLLLAIFFSLNRRENIYLLLIGIIGQISMINTFCHLHTPLAISILRTFNGLWLGILLGIILIYLVNLAEKKFTPSGQQCLKF